MGLDQYLRVSAELSTGDKMSAAEELALKATGLDAMPSMRFCPARIERQVFAWRKDYRVQSWIEGLYGARESIDKTYLSFAELDRLILDMQACITDPSKLDELFPFTNGWDWCGPEEADAERDSSIGGFIEALPALTEIRSAYNSYAMTITYSASW
jgi:hypothetical protein